MAEPRTPGKRRREGQRSGWESRVQVVCNLSFPSSSALMLLPRLLSISFHVFISERVGMIFFSYIDVHILKDFS